MADLRLSAHARLALARNPYTGRFGFSVGASNGLVTVTYLPHDMEVADDIGLILAGLEGMEELRTTMASTTILWVQETFDPEAETFDEVVEIAAKWNAAVELVRFVPGVDAAAEARVGTRASPAPRHAEAGIEDDEAEAELGDDGGVEVTLDKLAGLGRSGGARYVYGERASLVASCCGTVPHSLVVVGNLFLGKERGTKLRLTRELRDSLGSRMRVPVVTADELRSHYLFGRRDTVTLVTFLALVALTYWLVLTHQEPILRFSFGEWSGGGTLVRLAVAATVFVFVPLVAYAYGGVAKSLMKLIKME
jgi:hypothetical protein